MARQLLKNIFINRRFYMAAFFAAVLFTAGFFFEPLFLIAKLLLVLMAVALFTDISLLFFSGKEPVLLSRELPERFSNGDENPVTIQIKNNHYLAFNISVVDELPFRFQVRDFCMRFRLAPGEEKVIKYTLRPLKRGEYHFGATNVLLKSPIGLVSRRMVFSKEGKTVNVYPSFLNIRKYELMAISNRLSEAGIKKIRKVGQHSEFDQIREYVRGDDLRSINWKSTAKKGKLMSNQFQDERSQQVYNIIDMGRIMKMPFEGLSLLDYSINSSLILSNTAMLRHDRAGLITFNTQISHFMAAERRTQTLTRMMEVLFRQETNFAESDYETLYISVKRMITHRSLLVLYTNIESPGSLERLLPFFQKISRYHLLLVVLFENSEVKELGLKDANTLEEIYIQTIAQKFTRNKSLIVKELNNHGILSVLTRPQDLSVSLINKYLELKGRNIL